MVLNCPHVESEEAGIMKIDWNQSFLLKKYEKDFSASTSSLWHFKFAEFLIFFFLIDLSVLR